MRLINADSIMRKMVNMLIESGNLYLAGKAAALIDFEPTVINRASVLEMISKHRDARFQEYKETLDPIRIGEYFGLDNARRVVEDGLVNADEPKCQRQHDPLPADQ